MIKNKEREGIKIHIPGSFVLHIIDISEVESRVCGKMYTLGLSDGKETLGSLIIKKTTDLSVNDVIEITGLKVKPTHNGLTITTAKLVRIVRRNANPINLNEKVVLSQVGPDFTFSEMKHNKSSKVEIDKRESIIELTNDSNLSDFLFNDISKYGSNINKRNKFIKDKGISNQKNKKEERIKNGSQSVERSNMVLNAESIRNLSGSKISPRANLNQSKTSINSKKLFYSTLNSLSMFSEEFVVLLKVMFKSSIIYKEDKRFFFLTMFDIEGSEIELIVSNGKYSKVHDFVENSYELFQEGEAYEIDNISAAKSKGSKKLYLSDYTITLSETSKVTKLSKEDKVLLFPIDITFNFGTLEYIEQHQEVLRLDIILVCLNNPSKTKRQTKTGEKLVLSFIGGCKSGIKVDVTIWGEQANIDLKQGHILLCKNMEIKEFNGMKKLQSYFDQFKIYVYQADTLKLNEFSIEKINDFKKEIIKFTYESNTLYSEETSRNSILSQNRNNGNINQDNSTEFRWFFNKSNTEILKEGIEYLKFIIIKYSTRVQNIVTQPTLKNEIMYKIRVTANSIKEKDAERFVYTGCSICKKKLTVGYDEGYFCAKCDASAVPVHIYFFSLLFLDCSGTCTLTFNNEIAERFFRMNAEHFISLYKESREFLMNFLKTTIDLREHVLIVRPVMESYNGITKLKLNVCDIISSTHRNSSHRRVLGTEILKMIK